MELVWLVVYAVVAIFLAVVFRREAPQDDPVGVLLANRSIGAWPTALSVFATLTTESLIFFAVALTARYGAMGAVATALSSAAAVLVLSLPIRRLYASGVAQGFTSLVEFAGTAWGAVFGAIVRGILLLFLGWIIVLQVHLNETILSELLGWSREAATLTTVGMVALYVVIGSYGAVIRTDIFQSALLCIMIIAPFTMTRHPSMAACISVRGSWGDIALLATMSAALSIARPELWQRVYSATSAEAAAFGLRAGACMYAVMAVLVVYFAIGVQSALPDQPASEVFAKGYRVILPIWLAALFPSVLMAAMMSSLDSAAFLLASSLGRLTTSRAGLAVTTRLYLVLVLASAAALSLYVFDALAFAYKLNGLVALLAIPALLRVFIPAPTRTMGIALGAGLIIYVVQVYRGRIDVNPSEAVLGSFVAGAVVAGWAALRWVRGRR